MKDKYDFSKYKEMILSSKKLVKDNTISSQIEGLISLKNNYKEISKITNTSKKLDAITDCLLVVSSFEERAVALKDTFLKHQRICESVYNKCYYTILHSGDLGNIKTKTAQNEYVEEHMFWLNDISSDIDSYITRIDSILEYIHNLNFNLKTIMSTLKVRTENGYDK